MADEIIKRDQNTITVLGGITDDSNQYITMLRVDPTSKRLKISGTFSPATATLVVGSTTITNGTSTRILYDNAGVLGEYSLTGTGTVVAMQTSPTFNTSINVAGVIIDASDINVSTNNALVISTNNTNRWSFSATGHFLALTDNTYDIGAVGATRPRTLYLGTGAIIPALTATTVNGNTLTTGTYTLTGQAGKTLTFNGSITLTGTDAQTYTFPTTSATIARTDAANTFTGTQTIGALVATTVNGNTITTGSSTFTGTAAQTYTFPTTTATIARTDAAQTFTGTQTFSQTILTANAISASGNAATVPVTSGRNIVTNNSAATLTITLTTASAVNMQTCIVQVLDFSGVAQTLTFVNTENSTVSVPSTTNGSTTLPLTVGFIYNSATSKWRCVASA